MPALALLVASAALAVGALTGCAAPSAPAGAAAVAAAPQRANPASQNCTARGGTLSIERTGAGGEYGVCVFDDNRQCEEWALLRGECPVGGVGVAGYATPPGRYCAITGGRYAVTASTNTPDEQGSCTFKDGKSCNARAYYDGRCGR